MGADSLWYDETVSTYLAGQPVPALVAHTARDIHPPLYYLLLRGWLLLAGYPTGHADAAGNGLEFMAGFSSLWFGVLLVPLTWQLARRLRLGDATATIAALFVAVSPFGVWYSQEVRMYTLGAALGVICLLATLPFLRHTISPGQLRRAALIYVVAATAGIYTLYYFAFLLITLNALLLPLLLLPVPSGKGREADAAEATGDGRGEGIATPPITRPRQKLLLWLAAQAGVLLLYLPWLPTAWRQATDPPVPPWRAAPQLLDAIVESWAALTLGQAADPADFWPLLLLALALVTLGVIAAVRPLHRQAQTGAPPSAFLVPNAIFLVTAAFGPLLLILLASLITPLYHVRYLFTYSPAFGVLLAMGVMALWHRQTRLGRALAATGVVLLLIGSAAALRSFWTDPAYVADDHRSAVRELAQRWRPGDVILVNAGYAYPALLTYWPGPVAWHGRLTDYTPDTATRIAGEPGPVILQTGHVDGDANLGWGDPHSDFFAQPQTDMQAALRTLSAQSDRLWHYRIYDTVNDPQATIREALDGGWTLLDDRVYGGEANLRVQAWQGTRRLLSSYRPPPVATFGDWLDVAMAPEARPLQVEAGATIDVPGVLWTCATSCPSQPVALSLRLVDAADEVWAAHDEPLGGNVLDISSAGQLVQPLHLAVPVGTPPGHYDLGLIVYDPQTGQPLPAVSATGASGNQVTLGQVEITRPTSQPAMRPAQANFGPLRLVEATTPATAVSPGDVIPVELQWQAAPDYVPEPLVVVVQLLDGDGRVVAGLEAEPLDGRYSTAQWQPGELVRDRHQLTVPPDSPAGTYRLIVGLYRAADGHRLTTPGGLCGLAQEDHRTVREVTVR